MKTVLVLNGPNINLLEGRSDLPNGSLTHFNRAVGYQNS
jgi:3-dehydroquinate dehydratase